MITKEVNVNGRIQVRTYFENTIMVHKSNGVFLVDKDDEHFLNLSTWQIKTMNSGKSEPYVARNGAKVNGEHTLHRLIAKAKKGEIVDHINRNTLDNRKSNLRIVTASQNSLNRVFNKKNRASKYKGVMFYKNRTGYFRAQITVNRKIIRVTCQSEKEAALKYNELALKYHGEFARLNVIT